MHIHRHIDNTKTYAQTHAYAHTARAERNTHINVCAGPEGVPETTTQSPNML